MHKNDHQSPRCNHKPVFSELNEHPVSVGYTQGSEWFSIDSLIVHCTQTQFLLDVDDVGRLCVHVFEWRGCEAVGAHELRSPYKSHC